MAAAGSFASHHPGLNAGARGQGSETSPSWGSTGMNSSFDFQPNGASLFPPPASPPSRQRPAEQGASGSWGMGQGGATGLNLDLGTNPWANNTQFRFDGGSDSPPPRREAGGAAPTGWQLASGAASLAWKRLRYLDWLQGESLFSIPVHQVLQRPSNQASGPSRNGRPRGGDAFPMPRRGSPSTPEATRQMSSPSQSGAERQSPRSSKSGNPLLRKVSGLEDDEPFLVGLQKSFQTTWQAISSSSWCLHEGPQSGNYRSFRDSPETERSLPNLPALPDFDLDSMQWFARTVPPRAASAQPGGAPSPLLGARSLGSSTEVLSAVAAEQSTHDGQHPIQNMYQQDVLQVLSATRFSIFSKKGNKSTAPNQDRVLVAQLAGSMVLMAVLDGHGEVGHDVAEACTEVLPKLLLQRLSKLGMPSATSPGGSGSFFGVQNPQEAAGGGIADWWKEGAIRAFEEVHSLLEALTAQVMSSDDKESNLDALAGTANLQGLGGYSKIDSRTSGTTATVVLLIPGQRILVAHVGDSRAVLGVRRRGEGSPWRIRELTRDHKPDLPDERARIELFGAQAHWGGRFETSEKHS
ncbi:unnamed protein product [Polarella glacialis]|uniref:PPM-type phosphatase domain-containing protein n=2 Tax=Polarella glacialis TaxID=89957 RepID=A0A813IN89_POLGL|nr:unnamed protein product [Polarella glacialis]